MARSIDTIYSEIIAAKEADAVLNGLTSESSTAIFRLWSWISAAVMFTIEVMFDLFMIELSTLLETLKPGTLRWYQAMCKAFQYGDDLEWLNGRYVYAVIDATKQIVAQCSVGEGQGGLVVKIAREVSGQLEPLTVGQESAFAAYFFTQKYAGTRTSIVNSNANKLRVEATVIYDALLIAADGTLIADGSRPVDIAISSFLRNLPFDGVLRRSAIEDAIQDAPGVIDVAITLLSHKYGSAAYQAITMSHIPESGYYKIDTAYPLNTSITYNV